MSADHHAAGTAAAAGASASATGTAGGGAGARAAAEAAGAAAERFQAAQQQVTAAVAGAGGGFGGGGVNLASVAGADGVDGGLPSLALRDLLSFLQPSIVGAGDPAMSLASLEQAISLPVAGAMMNGIGGGGVMSRRRLQQPSAEEAREELQWTGLVLAPHQVSCFVCLTTCGSVGGGVFYGIY